MIIWCWDFDRTITIRHTCSGGPSKWERADLFTEKELENLPSNIKNPQWLAGFFRKCHEAGDKIFIVTRNPNKAHVETYLNILLGGEEQRKEIINDIHCRLKEIIGKPGKNGHIEEVFVKNNLPWPHTGSTSIILVDDEISNCAAADTIGIKTAWVKDNDSYRNKLEEIFTNRSIAPSTPTTIEAIDLSKSGSVQSNPLNHAQMKMDDIIDLASAKKYLDENVFKQNAEYAQKQQNISSVKEVFNALLDKLSNSLSVTANEVMDQISDFFDYINEPSRKDKLNCHKNKKYDAIFFKENTASWSNIVNYFRNKSLAKLLELQKTLPEKDRAEFLNKYRDKALFAEHRSNSIFTKLYNTDAVKAIDNAIEKCEKNLVKKTISIKSL